MRAPTDRDLVELANEMRRDDLIECLAQGYESATDAVLRSREVSIECYSVSLNGKVLGVFGVTGDGVLSGRVKLWLLTTREVDRNKKAFVMLGRAILKTVLSKWRLVTVAIYAHHYGAVRFALASGFKFVADETHEITGQPFKLVALEA